MNHRVTIDGTTFSSQYRRCGNPKCHCSNGPGHGPYWYARDLTTGKRRYIGRKLPAEVTTALHNLHLRRAEITDTLRQMRAVTRTLEALLSCRQPLSTAQKHFIVQLGFGDCLVQLPASIAPQAESEPQ